MLQLVNTNNPTKDTYDYFCIQCNKTEWIKEAIELNPFNSNQFVWIDFGIYHILEETYSLQSLNNQLYDKVRIASGSLWRLEKHDTYKFNYKKDILWFFCGGIFGGNLEILLKFSRLVKQKCLEMIKKHKHLMWEVNIWYLVWKENPEIFDNYYVSHDKTMIDNYSVSKNNSCY